MRRKNYKKRTTFTILLIVIAVLVVGYATLSSVLNLFGGLTVVGGNSFNVGWSNIIVNEDSTGIATTPPTITNNDNGSSKQINFVVNLNTPGDFYEFNVDAVNTGTIDAMIGSYDYEILDVNGDPVDVEYLNCTVSYADDTQLSSSQLLSAGETVTYKVRAEFSNDISASELPSGETAFRFEFVVSYVQADDTAYPPTGRIENAILIGDVSGISSSSMREVFSDYYDILYTADEDFVNTVAGAVSLETQANVKSFVEEYGAYNVVIILGHGDGEPAGLAAETFTVGDPTYSGPLSGVSLHTPVYHVFEPELLLHCDEELYESLITPSLMTMDDQSIIEEVQTFREQYSVPHSL